MRTLSGLALAATVMALPPCASAQEAREVPARALKRLSLEQLFDLEVTTVSQKPESLSKTAAAVSVVTGDDVRRMGALSLPEALRGIPGVEVARIDSRQYAITARGFNGSVANKLLVLIDGRSVYTPLFSGVFWDVQDVLMEDVEQIEVIRGPGATVWGANAVNGVINVRTKDAADTQGLLVTGGGGNAERGFGGVRFGGRWGSHTFFRVHGKHIDRDASLLPDGEEAGDQFRMSRGGMRVDWAPPGPNGITLQADAYGGDGSQPGSESVDLRGGNALARWTRRLSGTSDLELRGYYEQSDRDQPPVFREMLDTYDLELRHRFAAGGQQDVVWGLGYRLTRDDVRNSPGFAFLPPRLTRQLFTCFLQDEIRLLDDHLRLALGSKFEHNENTGFEYQPSVRLAWTPEGTQTLWIAASRAVRTPSRIDDDLFIPATPPYMLVGNRDFESEVLRALELGYKARLGGNLSGSIATFYNDFDRLRSLEVGPPAYLANGLEGRAVGVEADATYQVSSPWSLKAGYTYLDLDLERKSNSTDASQVSQAGDSPRHQAFLRSSLVLPRRVSLDLSTRYVAKLPNQQVPAYTTGDARLGWQATEKVELELVGRDLFAPQHAEFGTPSSRREVRRSIFARVTGRF